MKLTSVLIIIALVVCSSWAYPAGGLPDDEVEVIAGGGGTQPGYKPPTPSVPSIPNYPQIPSIPSYPVYPSYPYPVYPSYPTYPTYPTYSTYFPFGWNYNTVFSGFSNLVDSLRNQASTAWSHVPSIRPLISSIWPGNPNGTTTSTVKVVGDHKFIINETVHVQQNDWGHVVFKTRTVDIKPVDKTTEGADDGETTEIPEGVDIDQPAQTTPKPRETNDDDDDRVSIADTGDIDGVRAVAGSPELFDNANEIPVSTLEDFEVKK